ncbi:MAG: Stk1 family Ser/Thr kinase [Actinomycetota bacterium]
MAENERLLAGRYRVGRLVGRGGMAEVFEGVDTRLGRTVAIKILKAELANDKAFESKFRQEAQASARMAHPTIVRVYDAGEEVETDGNGEQRKLPYIIMEFVRGKLLRDVMHEEPVSLERSIKFVSGILTALDVSHRAGVVHRDIKPGNVMVVDSDNVKVMDFGIARAVSDNSATQVSTGGLIGTAQYFSPEQARGEAIDGRTDLYSTGVILYELLAGKPPFSGDSAVSVAYQHVSEAVTPPSQVNPEVSASLDAVVMRAMAKDREDRFQSAEEFREHLQAAVTGTSPTTVRAEPSRPISDLSLTEVLRPVPEKPVESTLPTSLLENQPTTKVGSERGVDRAVMIGLAAGAMALVIGLVIWIVSLGNSANPTIPSSGTQVAPVEGMLYEDAYDALQQQDLIVLRVLEVSEEVPAGTVIRQSPPSGTLVLPNTAVTLYVSSGAGLVRVPNIIGLSEVDALAALTAEGLQLGTVIDSNSASVEAGLVISSDPASGTEVEKDGFVNLVISNGKVMVPNVENLDVIEARRLLSAPDVGYTVSIEVIDEFSCTGIPGSIVIEQSIAPGPADQRQEIILYVECIEQSVEPGPEPEPQPEE